MDKENAYQNLEFFTCECMGHSCTQTVWTLTVLTACPRPFKFPSGANDARRYWGSKSGDDRDTLADGREWRSMHDIRISGSNSWLLCWRDHQWQDVGRSGQIPGISWIDRRATTRFLYVCTINHQGAHWLGGLRQGLGLRNILSLQRGVEWEALDIA